MTSFAECSMFFRAVAGSLITLLFFGSVIHSILYFKQHHKGMHFFFIHLLKALLLFFMSQAIMEYNKIKGSGGTYAGDPNSVPFMLMDSFIHLPYSIILLVCIIVMIGDFFFALQLRQWKVKNITPMSVKEAVDTIPEGVCVFTTDGRILLINRAMERFGESVTGAALMNGNSFSAQLFGGELQAGCRRVTTGEKTVILRPDGRVFYAFERDFSVEKETHRVLRVSEITEEYEKTMELTRRQDQVKALNEKLVRYNQNIVDLSSEKEVLSAKVKIHDELGSGLLAIRKYLLDGGSEKDRESILAGLRRNISFLQQLPLEKTTDDYELMIRTADDLGVRIYIDGSLPGRESEKKVIVTAMHECITNTLRHAHGDELYIDIKEDGASVTAVFRNNGKQPVKKIEEKGGLASLRELTERSGGSMVVRSIPEFSLLVKIPKEGNSYGI